MSEFLIWLLTVLLWLIIGLGGIVAGPFLVYLAVMGRVPRFIGPPHAVPNAVLTYWKGRLGCFIAGLIIPCVSIMILADGCPTKSRVSRGMEPAQEIWEPSQQQREAIVTLLASGSIWHAESPDRHRNRLVELSIEPQGDDLFQVRFAVESRDEYTNNHFNLSLGADDQGVFACGPGNMTWNGQDNPCTFELRPVEDKLSYVLLFSNSTRTEGILVRQ